MFGSTCKIYSKCTYLTGKILCTLSKHYHIANLKFCLIFLFNNRIVSKTTTLWRYFWAKSVERNKKHKCSGTKRVGICFYPVLPNWSVHSVSSVFYYISELFHHMEQMLSLSLTWDYLVIDDLVMGCPWWRTILLIAFLLKDMSLQIHLVSGSQIPMNTAIWSAPCLDWWCLFYFGVKCLTKDLLCYWNLFHIKTVIMMFYLNDHNFSSYKS